MSDSAPLPPLRACTVSHDIERYGALIDEMERQFGADWGDLLPDEVVAFLDQADSADLELLAFVMGPNDAIAPLHGALEAAQSHGIQCIVVADDLGADTLHALAQAGIEGFVSYPPEQGALLAPTPSAQADPVPQAAAQDAPAPEVAHEAEAEAEPAPAEPATSVAPTEAPPPAPPVAATINDVPRALDGAGAVFAVQGLSGGTGATTFAAGLAWELAHHGKTDHPRVCVLDLDLQFGAVASLFDLDPRPAVIELFSDTENMDETSFSQALQLVDEKLFVLTAPDELVPLDILQPTDVQRLIEMARAHFDYVIIDMPRCVTDWSETVLESCQLFFATLETNLVSAQNCARFRTALAAAGLPTEKLRFVLNRAPKFTDMSGRSRVKSMCAGLDIALEIQLPDGGKPVMQAADQGTALAKAAPKNPLRKAIAKLAGELHALGTDTTGGR